MNEEIGFMYFLDMVSRNDLLTRWYSERGKSCQGPRRIFGDFLGPAVKEASIPEYCVVAGCALALL